MTPQTETATRRSADATFSNAGTMKHTLVQRRHDRRQLSAKIARSPLIAPLATLLVVLFIELVLRLTPLGQVLPPPSGVIERLALEVPSAHIWQALGMTSLVALTGYVIGGTFGVLFGLIVGSSWLLWRAIRV